jgi:PAS domain S-box-containing protein
MTQDSGVNSLGLSALNEYKKAVDASTIFSIADLRGNIIYANKQFREVSGYSLDELIGKPHSLVRHSDMPSSAFKEMWDTIKRKEIWQGVVKNRKKNGEPYYVDATIVPIMDDNGDVYEYAGIRSDITELVLKTEELTAMKDAQRASDVKKALNLKAYEIVRSIPFPSVYVEGESNRILEYNQLFSDLFVDSTFLDEKCSLDDLLIEGEHYLSGGIFPLFNTYELCIEEKLVAMQIESEIKQFFIGMVQKNDGYIVSFQLKGLANGSI